MEIAIINVEIYGNTIRFWFKTKETTYDHVIQKFNLFSVKRDWINISDLLERYGWCQEGCGWPVTGTSTTPGTQKLCLIQ